MGFCGVGLVLVGQPLMFFPGMMQGNKCEKVRLGSAHSNSLAWFFLVEKSMGFFSVVTF